MEQYSIHWNGIKSNGSLVKCVYQLNTNRSIHVIAKTPYDKIPRDIFDVTNNSDGSEDYYSTDETIVYPDHPLYRFLLDAERQAEIHALLAQAKRFRRAANKGYMTASDKVGYIRSAERIETKAVLLKNSSDSGKPDELDFLAAIQYTKRMAG